MAILLNRLLPGNSLPPGTATDSEGAVLEACRASVQGARSLAFIPERFRDDVALLRGVCCLMDRIVTAPDAVSPASELARLEAELLGEVPGRALVRLARTRLAGIGIEPGLFRFLIAGVRRELDSAPLQDDDELLCYAYCVAGVVGLMLWAALDDSRSRAVPYILDLGIGLELTNIVRDWPADAARARCFLPARRLAPYGLTPQRITQEWRDPEVQQRLRPALEGMLRFGDHYYRSVENGAGEIPIRYRHALLILGRVYRREGWRTVQGAASQPARRTVPMWERAMVLSRVAGLALTPRVAGLVTPPPHDWRLHRAFAGLPGADPAGGAPEGAGTPSMASRLLWRRRGTGPVRRTW